MNSLGIDKEPKDTRVVVAMSGGVDSSVTAASLKEQGYDVVGITLQLFDHATAAIRDARQVADKIGVEHHVLDLREKFSQTIIKEFADSYLRGETPIPCVRCNRLVKFGDLLSMAKDLGGNVLATGHYVRRAPGAKGPELHRAVDIKRDQSYFLFAVTREQLDFARFPLGGFSSKAETRAQAERFGLQVAAKPDSQDICFIPNGDYASVVEQLRPEAAKMPGDIVDLTGNVLGRHEGIIHYTVGQRRGLNIGDRVGDNNDPLFVIRLNAAKNEVIVGPREALSQTEVHLREVNWLAEEVPAGGIEVQVRLRSAQQPVPARFYKRPSDGGLIRLQEPTFGVAPGQAGVIYDDSRLLGGGWITSKED